jgi:hypothetical protein
MFSGLRRNTVISKLQNLIQAQITFLLLDAAESTVVSLQQIFANYSNIAYTDPLQFETFSFLCTRLYFMYAGRTFFLSCFQYKYFHNIYLPNTSTCAEHSAVNCEGMGAYVTQTNDAISKRNEKSYFLSLVPVLPHRHSIGHMQ